MPALPLGLSLGTSGVDGEGDGDADLKKIVCTIIDLHKRAEAEKEDLADRLEETQGLIKTYEKSMQTLKMRCKFREAEVSRLKQQQQTRGQSTSAESEDVDALKSEIRTLQQELKVNVDAARLLTKNKALAAELRSLRSQYATEDDNMLLAQTRTRMLELEEIVKRLLSNMKDTGAIGKSGSGVCDVLFCLILLPPCFLSLYLSHCLCFCLL